MILAAWPVVFGLLSTAKQGVKWKFGYRRLVTVHQVRATVRGFGLGITTPKELPSVISQSELCDRDWSNTHHEMYKNIQCCPVSSVQRHVPGEHGDCSAWHHALSSIFGPTTVLGRSIRNNMDYSARLDHLQLQSLERRRLIADLVLTYRISFGLIDLNMSDYFALQSSSGCCNSREPI